MGRFTDGFKPDDMFDAEIKAVITEEHLPPITVDKLKEINREITGKIDNAEAALAVTRGIIKIAKMFI
jgi:hypothetical protein